MPIQTYLYDPYGNILNVSNDPVNNFTFVGRYGGQKDWDTGFVQFQHRWYDGNTGRWISRDPIGAKGGVNLYNYADTVRKDSEVNLYEYSLNNSTNRIDKNGLCSKSCDDPGNPECGHEYLQQHPQLLDEATTEQLISDYLIETGRDTAVFKILNKACVLTGPYIITCEATVEVAEAGFLVTNTIYFVIRTGLLNPISEGTDGSHI
jgi:RHS repeat-associated protein